MHAPQHTYEHPRTTFRTAPSPRGFWGLKAGYENCMASTLTLWTILPTHRKQFLSPRTIIAVCTQAQTPSFPWWLCDISSYDWLSLYGLSCSLCHSLLYSWHSLLCQKGNCLPLTPWLVFLITTIVGCCLAFHTWLSPTRWRGNPALENRLFSYELHGYDTTARLFLSLSLKSESE